MSVKCCRTDSQAKPEGISGNPVFGNITRGVSRPARADFSGGLEIFLAIGDNAFCADPFRFRTKPVGCYQQVV